MPKNTNQPGYLAQCEEPVEVLTTNNMTIHHARDTKNNVDVEVITTSYSPIKARYRTIQMLESYPAYLPPLVEKPSGHSSSITYVVERVPNQIRLADAPLKLAQRLEIFWEVCQAVAELNTLEIYLEEITPHSIFLDANTYTFKGFDFPKYHHWQRFDVGSAQDHLVDDLLDMLAPLFFDWLQILTKKHPNYLKDEIYASLSPWVSPYLHDLGTAASDAWSLGALYLWCITDSTLLDQAHQQFTVPKIEDVTLSELNLLYIFQQARSIKLYGIERQIGLIDVLKPHERQLLAATIGLPGSRTIRSASALVDYYLALPSANEPAGPSVAADQEIARFLSQFDTELVLESKELHIYEGLHKESRRKVQLIATVDPVLIDKYTHLVTLQAYPGKLQPIVFSDYSEHHCCVALDKNDAYPSLAEVSLSSIEMYQLVLSLIDDLASLHHAGVFLGDLSPQDIFIDDANRFVYFGFPHYLYRHVFKSEGASTETLSAYLRKCFPLLPNWLALAYQYNPLDPDCLEIPAYVLQTLDPWLTPLNDELETEQGDVWSLATLLYWVVTGRNLHSDLEIVARSAQNETASAEPDLELHRLLYQAQYAKVIGVYGRSLRASFSQAELQPLFDAALGTSSKRTITTLKAARRAFAHLPTQNLLVRVTLDQKNYPGATVSIRFKDDHTMFERVLGSTKTNEQGEIQFERLYYADYVMDVAPNKDKVMSIRNKNIRVNEDTPKIEIDLKSQGILKRLFG